MIGAASSKYFEGLLFILVRRPFSIGDGIALSGVNDQTASTGVSPPTTSRLCRVLSSSLALIYALTFYVESMVGR